jgi:hypothetical protein
LCIFFFFLAPYIHPSLDFPKYVVTKQNEFKQLGGNSQIAVPEIQPSVKGFVQFLPYAVDIAFFRPHVSEIKNKSYIPAAAEVILWWLMILAIFIRRFFILRKVSKTRIEYDGLLVFCLAFSISVLLLSGYTITVSGSIVRYRSIILPFLFAFFIYLLPYKTKTNKFQ